jgi:hypothetical protein
MISLEKGEGREGKVIYYISLDYEDKTLDR